MNVLEEFDKLVLRFERYKKTIINGGFYDPKKLAQFQVEIMLFSQIFDMVSDIIYSQNKKTQLLLTNQPRY